MWAFEFLLVPQNQALSVVSCVTLTWTPVWKSYPGLWGLRKELCGQNNKSPIHFKRFHEYLNNGFSTLLYDTYFLQSK